MKIVFVAPYFYPKSGGLETYVYNIAKGLRHTFQWNIVVITSADERQKSGIEYINGIKIYRLKPLFKISNTSINPFWYFAIKKIFSQEKPDIINAHAPVPFLADIASLAHGRIPFVLSYHAGSMRKGSFFYDLLISFYETFFLGRLFRSAKIVICSSQFVKKSLGEKFGVKTSVITPAVDTSIFKPVQSKRTVDILFVCRYANVSRLKGIEYLLAAIKHTPFSLRVVGEKFKTLQKNISFVGIKNGKDLAKEMQQSKVVVLPSIAPMESFGMVLIEAMATKTPVIGTHMGGIPEIINNGKNGFLVPSKDKASLQKAIKRILANKVLANKMGREGYELAVSTYQWKQKVLETQTLFEKLL